MATWTHLRKAWAAAAAAPLVLGPTGWAAAESRLPTISPAPSVSVVNIGHGSYRIDGSFAIATTSSVVWGVLTDYDRLSSFVSSMRSSVATRDASGRLLVTQQAVGRVGPFSRTMHVVLEVTEERPARIAFRDVCGNSFESYVGSWTIEPDGAGLMVRYTLEIRPKSIPRLFARSIMASSARGLLEQVRQEMLRRGRMASAR